MEIGMSTGILYPIGDNIRKLRSLVDATQSELASVAGVSEYAVSKWETGKVMPRMGAVERICACYGLNKANLIERGGLDDMVMTRSGLKMVPKDNRMTTVPIFGSIAAGTPIDMLEVEDSYPIPEAVKSLYPKSFLLKVEGESMNRLFQDGSYVLVNPCKTVEHNGQPYAICVNGYAATVKRVYKLRNGFELRPDSTDPTYRSKIYDFGDEGTETVTVIGQVVWDTKPARWTY